MNENKKTILLHEAEMLEQQACVNDAYRLAMELTTKRTHGCLGHLNAPIAYANHGAAAALKRKRAAELRELAK